MKLWLDTIYSQRDTTWASKILGFNTDPKYTIGGYGCLITALATFLTAVGHKETPDTLNKRLKDLGPNIGYLAGSGLFIWDSLTKLYGDVEMSFESPRWEDAVPEDALENLRDLVKHGFYVIIELDADPATGGEQMHFVGACGVEDSGEIMVADPWTGKIIPLSSYGSPAKAIYSYKAYCPTVPEEIEAQPYEEWKIVAWRFGRVFLAGVVGAVTVTALTTALDMELMEAVKYIAVVAIGGGLTALSKYLRDKYGADIDSLINKLPI